MRSRRGLIVAAGLVWAGCVLAGFGVLIRFKSTPGAAAAAPSTWPAESALTRASDRPTLLMFAHPRCPCTRSSLAELARLLGKTPSRPRVIVSFLAGHDASFTQTDLWTSAERLPDAQVRVDAGGREAARFAATTSGATLLYDSAGRLQFAGGITSARGHEGGSFGQERILALLSSRDADRRDSPVFGCPIGETTKGVASDQR